MGGEEEKEGAFVGGMSGMVEKEAHIAFPVMETGAGIVERHPGLGIGEQDDLQLLVGGPEDGRHAGLQVLRGIVDRNDDADQFPGHVTLDSSLSATSLPTM